MNLEGGRRGAVVSFLAFFLTPFLNSLAQNNPPTITSISDWSIGANLSTPNIPFRVTDAETPAANLTVTGSSSNLVLVPKGNIVFGGSGSNRTVRLTPALDRIGASRITLTVTDGGGATAASSFLLAVTNTPPTISPISPQSAHVIIPSAPIHFTVNDRETAVSNLVVTGSSANTNLIANANIVFGGSGANRTVQLTPSNQLGTVTVSITVADAMGGTATASFSVFLINDPPTMSGPSDQIIPMNSTTDTFPFTVGDTETPAMELVVSAFSSDTSLLPDARIVLGGSGTNWTITPMPSTDQVGTTLISVVVRDSVGGATTNQMRLSAYQFAEVGGTGLPGLVYSAADWGDYDNDGDLDLALAGTTGLGGSSVFKSAICRNNGDGTFTEINAGLPGVIVGGVAWGDYDNDGWLDLFLGGEAAAGSTARVYHNNGDGSFSDISAALTGVRTSAVAWGDYNNDGRPDLLITGYGVSRPLSRLYRNEGAGRFTDAGVDLVPVTNGSVAWGDYDNDGDLDILLNGADYDSVHHTRVYRNDGGSVFWNLGLPLKGVKDGSAAWGDYDNDDDLDILIGGSDRNSEGHALAYRNDGNDSFPDALSGLPGTRNIGVAWGDYDNDGDLDIAFAYAVYRSDNGQQTDTGNRMLYHYNGTILWGDYDKDGKLDILQTGYGLVKAETTLYRNHGTPVNTSPGPPNGLVVSAIGSSAHLSWSPGSDANQSGGLTYNLRVGTSPGAVDVMSPASAADGFRRVARAGNVSHNTRWILKGLSPGVYYWSVQTVDHAYAGSAFAREGSFLVAGPPGPPVAITEAPTEITFSDAILLGLSNPNGLPTSVWFQYGDTSNYGAMTPVQNIGSGTNEAAIQTTLLDLTASTTYHVRLVAANSAGTNYGSDRVLSTPRFTLFSEMSELATDFYADALLWADYDNDDDLDLLLAGNGNAGYQTWLLRNDGGRFSNTGAEVSAGWMRQVAWGDFDRDNNADLLSRITIYQNLRNGTFVDLLPPLVNYFDGGAAWRDYDNDGDLDVFLTGSSGQPDAALYRNDQSAGFTLISNTLPLAAHGFPSWMDYDNDGRHDLLLSGIPRPNAPVKLFHNNGDNTFTDNGTDFFNANDLSISWGDLDGDGLLDLANAGAPTRLFRNPGIGAFVDIGSTNLPDSFWVAWGDYDNDGRSDLVVGHPINGAWLFHNDGGVFTDSGQTLPPCTVAVWGDYDGDGDLDLALSGLLHTSQKYTRLFRNNAARPNAPPQAPTGLSATVAGSGVRLSWNASTDANQTSGFGYNLRVGTSPEGTDILSPLSHVRSGYHRIPDLGNAALGLNWRLTNLAFGRYYWSVQAIDHSYSGSTFAAEGTFVVGSAITNFAYLSDRRFQLSLHVQGGSTHTIQVSPDLVQWTNLTNFIPSTGGLFQVIDPQAPGFPARFYRLRLP